MDPLAFLSDDDGDEATGSEQQAPDPDAVAAAADEEAEGQAEGQAESGAPKRRRLADAAIRLEELQNAGYRPTELLETTAYLRDASGQEERRAQQRAAIERPASEASAWPVECGCEPPPPRPPAIVVRGTGDIPAPWTTFAAQDGAEGACGFPDDLRGPLVAAGFAAPSPIQAHAWPVLSLGRDLVGVAQTGSGKTLAYLLPCLAQLWAVSGSPAVVVLAPTRELVCQIQSEAARFQGSEAGADSALSLKVATVYGGVPKIPQLASLRAQPHLLVATPGRLNDILESEPGVCCLQSARFLVFDEADRMLDDGFEAQIRRIVKGMTAPRRQTMMFSATWPPAVQKLAAEFLRDPVEIHVGVKDELSANADVVQDVQFCSDDADKARGLVGILRSKPQARSIVFVATKRACRELARSMRGAIPGWVEAIHGDRPQAEREAALAAFRAGDARVLFATDVAGRGLDVPGVSLVINFDPPQSAEDYVHRIGRTGRAGARGLAISLLTGRDGDAMRWIAEVMQRTGVTVPPALARRVGPSIVPDNPAASLTSVMTRHPS